MNPQLLVTAIDGAGDLIDFSVDGLESSYGTALLVEQIPRGLVYSLLCKGAPFLDVKPPDAALNILLSVKKPSLYL